MRLIVLILILSLSQTADATSVLVTLEPIDGDISSTGIQVQLDRFGDTYFGSASTPTVVYPSYYSIILSVEVEVVQTAGSLFVTVRERTHDQVGGGNPHTLRTDWVTLVTLGAVGFTDLLEARTYEYRTYGPADIGNGLFNPLVTGSDWAGITVELQGTFWFGEGAIGEGGTVPTVTGPSDGNVDDVTDLEDPASIGIDQGGTRTANDMFKWNLEPMAGLTGEGAIVAPTLNVTTMQAGFNLDWYINSGLKTTVDAIFLAFVGWSGLLMVWREMEVR
jgi:hypothetical protein